MSLGSLAPLALVAGLSLVDCAGRPPAIEELAHAGFRSDVADGARGNAVFDSLWWSDDGSRFVTLHHSQPGLNVWEASTGRLISRLNGIAISEPPLIVCEGGRGRLLARPIGALGVSDRTRLAVFDLASGAQVASIASAADSPAQPWVLVDGGRSVVLSTPGALELWRLEPAERIVALESPLPPDAYRLGPAPLPATYNDKQCFERSPSSRYVAFVHAEPWPSRKRRYWLLDLAALEVRPLPPLPGDLEHGFTGFAFSHDDRRLAVGGDSGVWIFDVDAREWLRLLPGEHKRNRFLAPMRFSADDERLITLGDLMQVSTFQVATGELLGRHDPPFDDFEGVFRVSRDGSRVVLYHFVSDTLEVLDGANARRIGWVCAYFCNRKHQPVQVPYELSPDGRVVVASHRYGAALWSTDEDSLIAPLVDPMLPPAKER